MFEKLFGKNDAENTEIKEPTNKQPVETQRTLGIDPQTGTVMTKEEVKDHIERKEFRDLK